MGSKVSWGCGDVEKMSSRCLKCQEKKAEKEQKTSRVPEERTEEKTDRKNVRGRVGQVPKALIPFVLQTEAPILEECK